MNIASIQLTSQNTLDDNLTAIKAAIKAAKNDGADLIVLPENACLMGRQSAIAGQFGELCEFFQTLAKSHAVHLIAGTLPCPLDKNQKRVTGDKFFQTSLAIDNTGNIVARYDKIHLFRACVNDGVGNYDESLTFLAGETPVLAEFTINHQPIKVGMMICFDVRFPALAQHYRMLGADILVAPSAFTFATGQANWQMLLQARALDSQCLVVGAAQGGTHRTQNSERQTWGHSTIVQADGRILATTGQTKLGANNFLVAMARFDKVAQTQIRENLPIANCVVKF